MEEISAEEEILFKIKFVLSCGNDAQAVRLLEQYGQWQQERSYNEEEVHHIIQMYSIESYDIGQNITYDEWFEQFKKK